MTIPTIREQAMREMVPAYQAEALACLLPILGFTCWLYYAVSLT